MKDDFNLCPKCGNEVIRDEVDIGVGTMYGPAGCNECGWSEEADMKEAMKRLGLETDS